MSPSTPSSTPDALIRAEIALPTPLSLKANGGTLDVYQPNYIRYMQLRGEILRMAFGDAVTKIHAPTGTIDVIASPSTIQDILDTSHGKITTLHHHWTEASIRQSRTSGVTLAHPEFATP